MFTGQFLYLVNHDLKYLFAYSNNLKPLDDITLRRLGTFFAPNHHQLISTNAITDILNSKEIGTNYFDIVFTNYKRPVFDHDLSIPHVMGKKARIPITYGQQIFFDSIAINNLFELSEPSMHDLVGLSRQFAKDVVSESSKKGYIKDYGWNQDTLYFLAEHQFMRTAFSWFIPYIKRNNFYISKFDIIKFIFEKNLTMNSSEIVLRNKNIESFWLIFTLMTYFLLATQASIFATTYLKYTDSFLSKDK